jgi:hypothetical protein
MQALRPRRTGARLLSSTLHLLLSIDTEEDQWRAVGREATVKNTAELPRFQSFVEELGLRPTYFVNYPVATDAASRAIVCELAQRGAEIGAHVHPWNTPPFEEALEPRNTMMWNLPVPLQRQKIAAGREALAELLQEPPTSFRAGRLGLGRGTVEALIDTGFEVDSSVTPFIDWSGNDGGPDFDGAPLDAYRIDAARDPQHPTPSGRLREVPISCGFTRPRFETLQRIHRALARPSGRSPAVSVLSRLGLVRRILGSPEPSATRDLVALARCLVERRHGYVHLFLHSPSLLPGLTPFVPDERSRDRLYGRIRDFVDAVHGFARVEPATVGEYARLALP